MASPQVFCKRCGRLYSSSRPSCPFCTPKRQIVTSPALQPQPHIPPPPRFVCKACGHATFLRKRRVKGSFLIELILWLAFLLPGLIYSIWRLTTKDWVCPKCLQAALIPVDSPLGQRLLSEFAISPPSAPP
jgi:hypothetical protein